MPRELKGWPDGGYPLFCFLGSRGGVSCIAYRTVASGFFSVAERKAKMTVQIPEILIYNGQRLPIDNAPLGDFFELGGDRVPFLVNTTMRWRGYEGIWSLVDGKLWLDNLDGYIAKGPLVEIAGEAFRYFREYDIDLENPTMCSRITLEDIFPGAESSVFAHWFSGEINASLSDEIMRNGEGDDASVERTLKLGFQNGVLTSEDVVLKFPLTRGEIECGLTSADASARREFAESREYRLTQEQIERGLQDEDSAVRVAFISRVRRTLTPEQLERAMADECAEVRRYATLFENCEPTPSQLERALKDKNPAVRCNIVQHFSEQLTPEQVERGLVDEDGEVRSMFAAGSFQFTPAQIERGLTDKEWEVRYWFVFNPNIELTPEQIERGLNDEIEMIMYEIKSRYGVSSIAGKNGG